MKLLVKDLELSTRFLGSEKDLTILEADCQLIGLMSSPLKGNQTKREVKRRERNPQREETNAPEDEIENSPKAKPTKAVNVRDLFDD